MIAFEVLGTPGAKGSPFARVHNGHVVMHERKKPRGWERTVRERAAEACPAGDRGPRYVQAAIAVEIEFRIARPSGHWGKRGLKPSAPAWPAVKPDLDKLARSTLDALTGCVFDDDSSVVSLSLSKVYAQPGREGAMITVRPVAGRAVSSPAAERGASVEVHG